VKLYMFRKREAAPQPGKSALPVLCLVHGSSTSYRSFDLTVPGHATAPGRRRSRLAQDRQSNLVQHIPDIHNGRAPVDIRMLVGYA
jgi:hypothetical protein